jgi:hypothetical protein
MPISEAAAIKRQLSRVNPAFYASEYLTGPDRPPYHGKFLIGEHHEVWADAIVNHNRVFIKAARGFGKSWFATKAIPLWTAEFNPERATMLLSGSQTQAEQRLLDMQLELETNSRLAHLVPTKALRKRWSASEMILSNGHAIRAYGYGSKIRGNHPHRLICDDILNDIDSISQTVRERNVEYFNTAVVNMLEPDGQIIVVGTPQAADDLYFHLEQNPAYTTIEIPAILDEGLSAERSAWPDRFPLGWLKARRNEIGTLAFSREFMCKVIDDESSLFPMGLMRRGFRKEACLGDSRETWWSRGVREFHVGVDIAVSASAKADFFVVFVEGVDTNRNRWIVDIHREHGLDFTTQKELIKYVCAKYKPIRCTIESNQAQRVWGTDLRNETDIPVYLHQTGSEKHALIEGIPGLRVLFEGEKIRIPRGDDRSVALTDIWLAELHGYTFVKGKVASTTTHDDTAMGFWITERGITQGSSFRFFFDETSEAQSFVTPEGESIAADAPIDETPNAAIGFGVEAGDPFRRAHDNALAPEMQSWLASVWGAFK